MRVLTPAFVAVVFGMAALYIVHHTLVMVGRLAP